MGLPQNYPMVTPAYAARRSVLAKRFSRGTALRTAEQSAPKAPHLPVGVEEPTVPVPEPEHTVASVFANFPSAGGLKKGGAGRREAWSKRFAQQSARVGRRR